MTIKSYKYVFDIDNDDLTEALLDYINKKSNIKLTKENIKEIFIHNKGENFTNYNYSCLIETAFYDEDGIDNLNINIDKGDNK